MASEKVKTFTDNNFDDETSKGVVLVDFWAEWCGPCRRLAPTVDALASEFDGRATVAKLNVDENPNVPGRFAVRGIPTLLLFKEGQLAETIVGLRAKEDIAQMIERHLGALCGGSQRHHNRIRAGWPDCSALHGAREPQAAARRGTRSGRPVDAHHNGRELARLS